MSKGLITIIVLSLSLVFALIFVIILVTNSDSEKKDVKDTASLANPASIFCIENGGKLAIKKGSQGEFGVCVFEDGSECEEWDFYRGQCQPQNVPFIQL